MWYNSGASRASRLVNLLKIGRFAVGLLLRIVTFSLALRAFEFRLRTCTGAGEHCTFDNDNDSRYDNGSHNHSQLKVNFLVQDYQLSLCFS